MTPKQKELNLLGLASRARKLESGDEIVEKAIKSGKVFLVICSNEASQATQERYQGLCERNNVELRIDYTKFELSHAIGKSRTICALTDRGMAQRFLSYQIGEDTMNDK